MPEPCATTITWHQTDAAHHHQQRLKDNPRVQCGSSGRNERAPFQKTHARPPNAAQTESNAERRLSAQQADNVSPWNKMAAWAHRAEKPPQHEPLPATHQSNMFKLLTSSRSASRTPDFHHVDTHRTASSSLILVSSHRRLLGASYLMTKSVVRPNISQTPSATDDGVDS